MHFDSKLIFICFENNKRIHIEHNDVASIILQKYEFNLVTRSVLVIVKKINPEFSLVHLMAYYEDIEEFTRTFNDLIDKIVVMVDYREKCENEITNIEKSCKIFKISKPENSQFLLFFHQIRRMINFVVIKNDYDYFNIILFYMLEIHNFYKHDEDCKKCLVSANTPYLNEESLIELKKESRMKFLFEIESDSWSIPAQFYEFNSSYYETKALSVSGRVLRALESTNISDMYLYDDVLGIQSDSKRSEWANSAYAEFIDIKNEQLENENPENFKVLNEFP